MVEYQNVENITKNVRNFENNVKYVPSITKRQGKSRKQCYGCQNVEDNVEKVKYVESNIKKCDKP